jgi:hypothetical protein
VVWHRYDYATDARRLFAKVKEEYDTSKWKWFWQSKLKDIGITEADIIEPLRDLEAFDLQMLYTTYFLKKDWTKLEELSTSLRQFTERFMSDEQGLSGRIQTNRVELMARLESLKSALRKFDRPVLIELESGDSVLKNIEAAPIAEMSFGRPERSTTRDLERALSALQRPALDLSLKPRGPRL